MLLQLTDLSASYGDQKVLNNLSLSLNQGEILMLVGPNGAGKSTLLKSIFGLIPNITGVIKIEDELLNPTPHLMAACGISFVPQNLRLFPEMTVEENIQIGAYLLDDQTLIKRRMHEIYDLFPVLQAHRKKIASFLSGGQRQMLALGRSLILKPKILLLDEPSVGLAPKIITEIFDKIVEIRNIFKTAVIIVEHNLRSLLKMANRALIMVNGKIIKEGKPQELLNTNLLEEVFFGNLA